MSFPHLAIAETVSNHVRVIDVKVVRTLPGYRLSATPECIRQNKEGLHRAMRKFPIRGAASYTQKSTSQMKHTIHPPLYKGEVEGALLSTSSENKLKWKFICTIACIRLYLIQSSGPRIEGAHGDLLHTCSLGHTISVIGCVHFPTKALFSEFLTPNANS